MPNSNSLPAVATELPVIRPVNFTDIPKVIEKRGRVVGIEALRDRLLEGFEAMVGYGMNPLAILKLVLETDKHAMFSELHVAKKKGIAEYDEWAVYQTYLRGETEEAPEEPAHRPSPASASEDKITELIRATGPGSERPDDEG